jgi:cell division protein FtsL
MIRFDAFLVTLLIVLTVGSALGVISSQHQARKFRSALELEQKRAKGLDVEWGRLQIEQSTQAEHRRIERFARERLRMSPPQSGQIIVLEGRP